MWLLHCGQKDCNKQRLWYLFLQLEMMFGISVYALSIQISLQKWKCALLCTEWLVSLKWLLSLPFCFLRAQIYNILFSACLTWH